MSHEPRKLETQDEPDIFKLRQQLETQSETFIAQLKLDDPQAWENLVILTRPRLTRAIQQSLAVCGLPRDRQDDVEQEVWKTAREKITTFTWQGEVRLHRWLARIAKNCTQSLKHKEKPHASIDAMMEDEADPSNSYFGADRVFFQNRLYTESAEIEVLRKELQGTLLVILDRALRELSARDREIVLCRLLLKEKPEIIATRFNLKVTNVYQIVNRAKKTMQKYLVGYKLFRQD